MKKEFTGSINVSGFGAEREVSKASADEIVALVVKALDIRGHGDITEVIEPEQEGSCQGIEVIKHSESVVSVGGWIWLSVSDSILVELYSPGHRGEPTLSESKQFPADEAAFAVAWAMGKMLEAELSECL